MPSKRKTSEADSAAAADVRRSKRLAREQSAADATHGGTRYDLDVFGRMELHHHDEENRERERARDVDGPVARSGRPRSCPPSATYVPNVERAVSLRNHTSAPGPIPTSGPAPGSLSSSSSSVATLQPREQMAKQPGKAMQTLTQSQIYTIISQEPHMGNELAIKTETGTGIGTGTTRPSTTTLPFISRTPASPRPQFSYNNDNYNNIHKALLYGIPATPCHGFVAKDQRLARYRQDMRPQYTGGYRYGGGSGAGETERQMPLQNDKTMNQVNGNSKNTGTDRGNDQNIAKGIPNPIPFPISTSATTTASASRPDQQERDRRREDLLGPAFHMTLNPVVRRSRTCACASFCVTMMRPS